MQPLPENLRNKLNKRRDQDSLRQLVLKKDMVDFVSNDYLGFARNKELYQKTNEFLKTRGISINGATGSRLLSGNNTLIEETEKHIANFQKAEAALIFNSGYDANVGIFSSIPQRGDLILYDEYVHASIRDGIRMSLATNLGFKHNNITDLSDKLIRFRQSGKSTAETRVYVVTESVFSMDGDSPDLAVMVDYCKKEDCLLILDEAHAFGIIGDQGRGMANELGIENQMFARVITFGKALGCHGAAVLCSAELKEYLINFARSFIYTTSLSSHAVASILVAHQFLASEIGEKEQTVLNQQIGLFKKKVRRYNLENVFVPSNSAIQSCLIAGNTNVRKVSEILAEGNLDVRPILSPTVPENKERLRFCLHSFNTDEEIENALILLAKSLKNQ